MLIRFTKSPVGKYSLCYEIGEEINIPDSQAMDLIADGYAIPVLTKPENASEKLIAVESR